MVPLTASKLFQEQMYFKSAGSVLLPWLILM